MLVAAHLNERRNGASKKKKAARHLPHVNCAILTKNIIPVEGRSVKGILGWVLDREGVVLEFLGDEEARDLRAGAVLPDEVYVL